MQREDRVHERPRHHDGHHRDRDAVAAPWLTGDLGNAELGDDRAHDGQRGETGENQQGDRAFVLLGGAAADLVDAAALIIN